MAPNASGVRGGRVSGSAVALLLQQNRAPVAAVYHVAAAVSLPAVSIAPTAALPFVLDLQRRFSNQLGFLPRAALEWYVDNGRVRLCQDNDEHAGYLLGRTHLRCQPWVQPITQAAVCFDAQRRELGRRLVDATAAEALAGGRSILQAWCRTDVEANAFWRACGFLPIGIRRPLNARQRPLILWRRPLDENGRTRLLHLPPVAGFRAAVLGNGRLLTPTAAELVTAACTRSI